MGVKGKIECQFARLTASHLKVKQSNLFNDQKKAGCGIAAAAAGPDGTLVPSDVGKPQSPEMRNNMHENREISCTSWSSDRERSAKAINRKADANVQEKSDCAVIPVNQPNNEGQPSAEAGEGRAQTQENIVQSRMRPTQSEKRMSQGLSGVRKAARARKQERFTALLHHLSVGLLRDSFYALKRQASPG